jgi:hypothetical protein
MDIMAIDGEQVPTMQAAIENYTTDVEKHLNDIRADDITVADGVYGTEQIATVNAYIEETCTQINTIVRYFDDFKEKLVQVKEAYDAKQSSISLGTVEEAKAADESEMVNVSRME